MKPKNLIKVAKRIFGKEVIIESEITGEFPKRIINRHARFWKPEDAELVRNTLHRAGDPISEWKDKPMWQRKLSNKANAREFALKFGCQVAELYWRGRDLSKLDFNSFPPYYVIRPTTGHSTNNVYLMSNGFNFFDKKTYTIDQLRALLQGFIDNNPKVEILVEEFVQTEEQVYMIPADYKMYLFNGEMAVFQVSQRWALKQGWINFYDETWQPLPPVRDMYPPGPKLNPPKCFKEMVEMGKRLSKAYEVFVRVDFYATPKGPVFGEFTPTPGLGKHYTPYGDKLLTDYWDRYSPGCY